MNRKHITALFLAAAALAGAAQAAVYVDASATGANDGTSWTDAYTNLAAALAAGGTEDIWVAEGTYTPGADRASSFQMKPDTALYGGFTNGMTELADRDWGLYPTVLSGDIGTPGDNSDNCYQVVLGASNAVLDGFTVTGGCSTNSPTAGEIQRGAGMYVSNCSPTIIRCRFTANASTNGGGLFLRNSSSRVEACEFDGNYAAREGGGFATYYHGGPILDCTFSNNAAGYSGGGFACRYQLGSPVISNCLFVANTKTTYGAGMRLENWRGTVVGCTFVNNSGYTGGGFYTWYSAPLITNCLFTTNQASTGGGAGGYFVYNDGSRTSLVVNCTFSGNRGGKGGAITTLARVTVKDCRLVGNGTDVLNGNDGGGAIGIRGYASSENRILNCLIAGNYDSSTAKGGGGICYEPGGTSTLYVINSTIVSNRTQGYGGGLYSTNGNIVIRDSIIWNNSAAKTGAQYYVNGASGTSRVSYTAIEGGIAGLGVIATNGGVITDGSGNLDGDPRFAGGPAGQWTSAGVFDANLSQSTLTDSGAAWTPGALAGLTVNPDTTQWRQYAIVTNTATTLTVWGGVVGIAHLNDNYRILDYHEQSRAGRWTKDGWVKDPVHSPCIDAGDPASAWALEPEPNGERINMGAYGNTAEASLFFVLPVGTVFHAY